MNDRPSWLFDESRQVGVDYMDVEVVRDYDRQHERFRSFDDEARAIAQALCLAEQSVVLDLGCGTGELTIRFARMCKRVYAVDVSPVMLQVLRDKLAQRSIHNVDTCQAGFLTYQHQGAELDAVVANVTLHHLSDFWKQIALCQLHDLLKPDGKLFLGDVVFGFEPRAYRAELDAWIARMQSAAGRQMADETVVHVRDEFSTWDWIQRGLIERAGLRIDSSTEIMPHVRAYVCSKE